MSMEFIEGDALSNTAAVAPMHIEMGVVDEFQDDSTGASEPAGRRSFLKAIGLGVVGGVVAGALAGTRLGQDPAFRDGYSAGLDKGLDQGHTSGLADGTQQMAEADHEIAAAWRRWQLVASNEVVDITLALQKEGLGNGVPVQLYAGSLYFGLGKDAQCIQHPILFGAKPSTGLNNVIFGYVETTKQGDLAVRLVDGAEDDQQMVLDEGVDPHSPVIAATLFARTHKVGHDKTERIALAQCDDGSILSPGVVTHGVSPEA